MHATDPIEHLLFVSYAHEDRKMVEELRKPFIPLERRYGCTLFWDDSRIRFGEGWRGQIERAMAQARFAVLLMSPDFMGSDFIHAEELPRLLSRHRAGSLILLPILVGPIDVADSGVGDLQFVNPPELPLKKLKPVEREAWFLQVAQRVKEILLADGEIPPTGEAATGPPATIEDDEPSATARRLAGDTAAVAQATDPARVATWEATIPANLAVAEIESQLLRLKQYTRTRGFSVFDCDGFYVQFDYFAALDDSSVIVEAQANAFLKDGRRLSRQQLRYLTEELQFSQASPDDNLHMYAPMASSKHIAQLARLTWYLLTEVYPSGEGCPLNVSAQCR